MPSAKKLIELFSGWMMLPRDARPLQTTVTLCSPRFLLNSTMTIRNKMLRRVQGMAATRESEMKNV
jgi:hypothetical protein